MLNYRQKHKDYNNFTCTNNNKKKTLVLTYHNLESH